MSYEAASFAGMPIYLVTREGEWPINAIAAYESPEATARRVEDAVGRRGGKSSAVKVWRVMPGSITLVAFTPSVVRPPSLEENPSADHWTDSKP